MRKAMACFGLAAALVVGFQAAAQPSEGAQSQELLEQVLVLRLANEIGLSDEQTVKLVREHGDYLEQLQSLREERLNAKASLIDAVAAGKTDSEIQAHLKNLRDIDRKRWSLLDNVYDALSSGLSPAQSAELYMFMSEFEANVRRSLQEMRRGMDEEGAAPRGERAGAGPKKERPAPEAKPAPTEQPAPAEEAAAPAEEAMPEEAPVAEAPAEPAQSDEEAILAVVKTWTDALAAQDLDKSMTVFSENFEHYEYGDKQGLRDFIGQALEMGYLDGIESDVSEAEIEYEDDTAIIYPIDLMGVFGSVTFEFTLSKEDGKWIIVGLDAYGI